MRRNNGLDFLKFVCAFLVVCIHIPFPHTLGIIIKTFARVAVPIYFMITGYFYESTKRKNGELKQIKKLFCYFVVANILYFLWNLILAARSYADFLGGAFNLQTFIKFVLFNDSPFGGHLWYLGAILYVVVFMLLFEKKWSRDKLYPIIPILLATDLILGKYSVLLFGREFPIVLVRNFLFVGIPYFLMGDMIFRYKWKFKTRKLIVFIGAFAIASLLERYTLTIFNVNATRDHYVSTTFLAFFVFLLCEDSKWNTIGNSLFKWCCFGGEKLTTYIYIVHPVFVGVVLKLFSLMKCNPVIDELLGYTYPVIVFAVSVPIAWLIYVVITKFKKKSKNDPSSL